jgi:hypothetical protein
MSSRETFKMAGRKGMASTLGVMWANMRAAGRRIICMD